MRHLEHEFDLEMVVKAETAERRRILEQVYSLIMSSGNERKSSNAVVNNDQVQKPNSLPDNAFAIPRGKYLTIAQVTETCGVNKRTVTTWLKKGLLKSLDLPGLGQIVEEKDLGRYLAESQNRS
jgi:hypothetical protein